jgi:manganese transport protein
MPPNTFYESHGWQPVKQGKSLEDVHGTIAIQKQGSFFKKLLAFSGPGYLVAVGYMDPGNWATDLAGGSKFGYSLLSVILISNCMAIVLQYLSLKLGIVMGRDLAQACRDHYSKPVSIFLWLLAEIAIIACDLAEVIGSALALYLLFHIPLVCGVIITALDVLLLLMLQQKSFRYLESLVIVLIFTILACFAINIFLSMPHIGALMQGFIPTAELLTNAEMLYIAIGILGATVMPHNLYLHSAVVQTRSYEETHEAKQEAIFFSTIDSTVALCLAFLVNAGILVVAAAVFNTRGMHEVAEIQDAYHLLSPLLGTYLASVVFACALLASGQNATVTGTLAGQIIMEGFTTMRCKPWLRRFISRALAIVPAIIGVWYFGQHGLAQLLLLSQVVLSLQLPFAVFPLVLFTSQKEKMGDFVNTKSMKIISYSIAYIIALLNGWLLYSTYCNCFN